MNTLLRRFVLVSTLVIVIALSASAATLTPVSGTVTAAVVLGPNNSVSYDLRGAATLGFTDPTLLDTIAFVDPDLGADPFPGNTLPFGNTSFFAVSLAPLEFAAVNFDLTTAAFPNSQLALKASVTPAGGITNSALTFLTNPVTFFFNYTQTVNAGGFSVNFFELSSVEATASPIPEPDSFVLAGSALALAAGVVSRRRARLQ